MSATLKGCAAIWGTSGFGIASGVVISSATAAIQSLDTSRSGDVFTIADSNGITKGRVFFNNKIDISIDVIPISTSIATSKSNAAALMPAPGEEVTIADADCTVAVSGTPSASGKYSVMSSTMKRTNTGVAVISMQLSSYDDNNVTTAASA